EGKAKLSGLLIERSKVEITGADSYDGCETAEDVAAKMAEGVMLSLESTHSVTEEDRQSLINAYLDALESFSQTTDEITERLTAEVRSRPLGSVTYHSPVALPSPLNGKATAS